MMTTNPGSRYPVVADDDLLLDRPAPQGRRRAHDISDARPVRDLDMLDARGSDRPIIVAAPPARRPTVTDALSRGIGLLAKLTLLLILLAVLWGVVSFV